MTDFALQRIGSHPSSDMVLSAILPMISIGVGFLFFFLLLTCIGDLGTSMFLIFMFIGSIFAFSTQSAIMRCVLNSVDKDYRPNAVGFNAVLKHLFGDIPGTIIFGLVKDSLAPDCIIDANGEFIDPEGCKSQKAGSRTVLLIMYAYYGLSILFFELAHCLALSDIGAATADNSTVKTAGTVEDAIRPK